VRRAWDWYLARRLWVRIAIAAPVCLFVLATLYLVSRGLQYRRAAGVAAAEFAPSEAQVVVRATDLARHWSRLQSSDLWKGVQQHILRDATLRKEINRELKAAGAPTLDDLEDERFMRRTGSMLTEANLLRFAGRDVMLALRVGATPEATRFCAATRLGFWEYAAAPFAPLVLEACERGTYRAGRHHIAIAGAMAVVSDDAALLQSALRRRGREGPTKRPVEAAVTFDGSPTLARWRAAVSGPPEGDLLIAEGSPTRVTAWVDFDGPSAIFEARLEGLTAPAGDAPSAAARWIPGASGAGAVLTNVSGERLWERVEAVASGSGGGFMQGAMREAVGVLANGDFAGRVPPRLTGPASLVLGSTKGTGGRTFGAFALVARCDDAGAAERGLHEAISDLIGNAQGKIRIGRRPLERHTLWALEYSLDAFQYNDFLRPSWVAIDNALVVANNPDFLQEVVAAATLGQQPLVQEPFYEAAQERLARLGLDRVLGDGAAASGFVYGPGIREGIEGFWPMLANKLGDNEAARRKLTVDMQARFREEGRNPAGREYVEEWNAALKERIADMETRLRARARAVDAIRWMAFQATAEEGGLVIRGALELK
jgi:hypothetical protein